MKLKEIKNNTVVHCKTIDEAKKLIELTGSSSFNIYIWERNREKTCYRMYKGIVEGFSNIDYYKKEDYEVVEFSDLIIPELTAEEVLKTYAEMCAAGCNQCPFKGVRIGGNCERFIEENIEEAVHLIAEWKAQRGKKETEIEWVYRVFGAENFGEKFFETEDEAIKKCEELVKTQKTKNYARYERVCRVKENNSYE